VPGQAYAQTCLVRHMRKTYDVGAGGGIEYSFRPAGLPASGPQPS
jgi:hypothetical protein